jgi:RNA polymerase sigma-70 factor (ECF subfamily)
MALAGIPGFFAVDKETDAAPMPDFEAAMETYGPRVFRFALASLRDRDLAKTVTQDCFFKAHRGWRQFRGDANLQTWLMQIAINLIRDVARNNRLKFWKRMQTDAVDLDEASEWIRDRAPSPEARAAARQQVAAIWNVVTGLSERQRTVFLLHFMEGMNPVEIESVTGVTRAAVKVHLFRAIHAVRERLAKTS